MSTVISVSASGLRGHSDSADGALSSVCHLLPPSLRLELEGVCRSGERIEEIRLRKGRCVYLTVGCADKRRRNLMLSCVLNGAELSDILNRMCDGSLYAYSESIIKGFITLSEGVRVGVCGRASVEGGRIMGIYSVSALNIRLPCAGAFVEQALVSRIRGYLAQGGGVLIYSPPSGGKTTFLRALALRLASGQDAMRVAHEDSRDELGTLSASSEASVDLLTGYPKAEGIRIATAFMNPQVIVCDEIGDGNEASEIAEAQNCGVPLIATVHGTDVRGIMRREEIRRLHSCGAFSAYVGISSAQGMRFTCTVTEGEEISLEDIGNDPYLP